jgi:hypothetical protein
LFYPDDEEDEPKQNTDVGDYMTMKSRVMRRQCGTCIFAKGNPFMDEDQRKQGIEAKALANEGFIPCHSTYPPISEMKYPGVRPAVCRGFWSRYKDVTGALRMMQVWGITYMDLPEEVNNGEP